ncbi:hypothetical protein EZS27_031881 [termite gut metagenome]|uniref:Peptidase C14 caspase domain-containing protein n=1 Tax=termite gut metagenome TaxID=433724 RepID=A0A5J4QA74_9ZZZZ
MKRKAILFGNTNGLQGVSVDLLNYEKFLQLSEGGAWDDNEIITLPNPSKWQLKALIASAKLDATDFVFVVYSGHGGYNRSTILEINGEGETIDEKDLWNIAPRQITILDCCRGTESELTPIEKSVKSLNDSIVGSTRSLIRTAYNKRIMSASIQQVKLYSCSIGETSIDTGRNGGGLYTKNLFQAINDSVYADYLTINDAHAKACIYTSQEAKEKHNHEQNPDSSVIRCSHSQQLIVGINPSVILL